MQGLIHKFVLIAPAALFLWGATAQATTQTGQISVVVTNEEGKPIAGATVELSAKQLIGGTKKVSTDENGTYRFLLLPPGSYEMVVSSSGLLKVSVSKISVKVGRTATVSAVLKAVAAEPGIEEIVVTGSRSVLDTESLTLGNSITDEFMENVPSSRNYQDIAFMMPGVTGTSAGGGNPHMLGSTYHANQYLLDGVNVTDPVTNTFSANFNFDAIQSVEVLTGGRDAEYGTATGGVINIVTKSGSNEHHADASIYYEASELQVREEGEDELINRQLNANVNVGGPIIKDKLWYFVSAEVPWTQATASDPEGGTIFPDRKGKKHPSRNFLGFYGLGKLTYQYSPDQVIKLMVQADPALIENTKQDPTAHPDAERRQLQTGYVVSLASETFLSANTFWNNRIAYSQNRLEIGPMSQNFDLPGRLNNVETGADTINDTYWLDDKRYRVQIHSALGHMLDDFYGEHQFKLGLDVSLTWNQVFDSIPGGGYYKDNGTVPGDPDSISGVGRPYEFTRLIEAQDTTIFGDTEGVYIQDVWKPFTNLTIRPGLRFDSARMRNWEGDAQIKINTLSPRIGVAWDPFDDGRTKLSAGYYQYVDTGYLALSDFAGGKSRETRTYSYNAATDAYDKLEVRTGGASGNVGKAYLKDAWNQRRPRTHEFLLGAARELLPNLELAGNFIYRHNANQWEDDEQNVIWNETGDEAIGFVDGEQHFIYSLGAMRDAYIRYWAIEATVTKLYARNWEMLFSYTYSRTQGTHPRYLTVAFDRPKQREFEFGWLPHDRRHVVKLDGSYRFPYGIVAGARARYQSGQPYNRKYFNGFYGDYNDFRASRGYDLDEEGKSTQLREPPTFRLDTRFVWQLEELTGQRIDVILEAINVLNARTPVEYEERNLEGGATQFGDVTDRMNPLTFAFGLRYRI